MQYTKYFQNMLLEQGLPEGGNSRTYSDQKNSLASFLDTDTPEEAFDTEGMPDLTADLDGFMSAIEDFKQKKEAYVKKAQTLLDYYSNALESLDDSKNVSASAVKVRDSVGGYNSLSTIVKRLEDIVKQTQDKGSTEDIERMLSTAKATTQEGDPMTRGNPQSTGPSSLGMSYSESRQRRSKHHRRPVRG